MATGRQTASRRSMCSVQQIGDDEQSKQEEVSSGPGWEIEEKKLTATSSASAPSEWRVRERACKEACACAAGPARALPTVPAGGRAAGWLLQFPPIPGHAESRSQRRFGAGAAYGILSAN